jgi:release factor glutamine methyltransferase
MDPRALLTDAARRLTDAGVESARVDAELLLAAVLGVSRNRLLTLIDVPDDVTVRFAALLDQRADRVPLQHLTGRAPFRYLELAVGPGVFVPRPETEQLAGWAVERLAGVPAPLVVDLGAGSGALRCRSRTSTPARASSPWSGTPARSSGPGTTRPPARPPVTRPSRSSAGT